MFRAVIIVTILTTSISCETESVQAETIKQRSDRIRREIEQKRAKTRAKSEKLRKSFEQRRSLAKKEIEQNRAKSQAEADQVKKSIEQRLSESAQYESDQKAARARIEAARAFEPSAAPRPEVCFNSFLKKARSAKSFEEILPYLSVVDREYYKRIQKEYDPKRAQEQRQRYEAEGGMSEASIAHMTNPPYTKGLAFYQRIAKKIRKFKSSEVDGNKAVLHVTIHADAVVNGLDYTKGTATINMVGEGKYWYIDSYDEGAFVYR